MIVDRRRFAAMKELAEATVLDDVAEVEIALGANKVVGCTFDFAYVGSRTTGNDAELLLSSSSLRRRQTPNRCPRAKRAPSPRRLSFTASRWSTANAGAFLLAGPAWRGETPPGIKAVIRSETEFAFVLFRTQLFNPGDIANVKKIQAGYKVEPLSQFLGKPSPPAPPAIDFIKPLGVDVEKTSPEFFNILNFVLRFCPTDPSETDLMARFARLGIGAYGEFDAKSLSPEIREAIAAGTADAWAAFREYKETELDTGKKTSADGFGTREFLNGDYLARMSAAASASTATQRMRLSILPISSTRTRSRSAAPSATAFALLPANFRPSKPSGRSPSTSCHRASFRPTLSIVT